MAAATDYPTAAGLAGNERPDSTSFSPSSPTGAPGAEGDNAAYAPDAVEAGSGSGGGGGGLADGAHARNSYEVPKPVQDVLQSEIGIMTMLNRLKQSIATAKEFALFLKKRAQLEEDYSAGMRKLSRATQDSMARNDQIQGSFGQAFGEMMDIHGRMADNGYQFAMSLHQMHEDLLELAAIAEKNRKGWKQTGLAAEQRVADLETATRKSKAKYDALAEEYDRARTGDVGTRRGGFGFKGPKSAAQHEEDLLRKLQASDEDYHGRVVTLARERAELLATGRPEIVKALQDLVRECDGGMVLQVQKYASFSEKLLLSNGLSISPIKSAQKPNASSLREVVTSIDTERDLNNYLAGFHSRVPPKTGEPKYERHAVLGNAPGQAPSQLPGAQRTHTASQSVSQPTGMGQASYNSDSLHSPNAPGGPGYGSVGPSGAAFRGGSASGPPPGSSQQHERSFSYSSGFGPNSRAPQIGMPAFQQQQQQQQQPLQTQAPPSGPQPVLTVRNSVGFPGEDGGGPGSYSSPANPTGPAGRYYANNNNNNNNNVQQQPSYGGSSQGPPQLGALPFQTGTQGPDASSAPGVPLQTQQPQQQLQRQDQPLQAYGGGPPPNPLMQHPPGGGSSLVSGQPAPAPSRPVFGVPLDVLYERDGQAVPMVVQQCIQAVEMFGLTIDGIYRESGSAPNVSKLKVLFDTDAASPRLNFLDPADFYHSIHTVTSLLKQFFRELPDPLLTRANYDRFIEAAQHDDDTVRRDSLHAVINDLPDPNYATLRELVLHLHKVVENKAMTRMTTQNLAIVFAPTLMGAGLGDPEKGRWHVRVIDTILQNTLQIFDAD
ncbi:Rho GTPase activator [Niveomyces insectorum RCEF 264]|uniref:Rho GTPase activator n=1 Tax=Niveomyces insectorum RCEF 264 TaxID=1081102 RepID=A0A167TB75_9HYPO|nr:Rho GTPase activator [Niveomyces insectorum RCEF 264]